MAYRLQIMDTGNGIAFNIKYQNLSKAKKPDIIATAHDGSVVKERTVYQGQVLGPGATQRKWCNDQGDVFSKSELQFWHDGDEVEENVMTKSFEIVDYQALKDYNDLYVMDKFYEVLPGDNDMKKDIDKERARISNLHGMRKLWEHLNNNRLVARGEFCVSSRGFVPSDGYIRAVEFGNHWGLEIGVFKEQKIFEHLQESIPSMPAATTTKKRLKMVNMLSFLDTY